MSKLSRVTRTAICRRSQAPLVEGARGRSSLAFGWPDATTTITVDLYDCDAVATAMWLYFLAAFIENERETTGRKTAVVSSNIEGALGFVPDGHFQRRFRWVSYSVVPPALRKTETYAVIASDHALTRRLLSQTFRVHIQPKEAPSVSEPVERSGAIFGVDEVVAGASRDDLASVYDYFQGRQVDLEPRATLITSIFDGDRYLAQFLANSAALDGYDACEHLLIRAGSPGNEHADLVAHVAEHPGAIYLNLATDPGLYEVWNLGVQLARAPYLSNANLDDRRAPEQLERMCRVLDEWPDVDVASSPLRISYVANTDWSDVSDAHLMFGDVPAGRYVGRDLLRYDGKRLRSRNLPHCMPVWRRELHARLGFFDEARFGPSADWEFWLRAGRWGAQFHFSGEPLGAFLRTPDSYWQQGSGGFDYDRRIAAFYRGLWDGTGDAFPEPWPSLEELRALSDRGAYLELTGRFAVLVDEARAANGRERPAAVDALARRLFSLPHAAAFERFEGIRSLDHRGFCACLRDFVLDVCDLGGVDAGGLHWLPGLAWEGLRISSDWDWHLVHARTLGVAGNPEGRERSALRELHVRNRERFWRSVQPVYRFTVTLDRLAELVDDPVQAPASDGPEPERCKLCFYPDYRDGNLYQTRLYAGFEARGAQVVGTSDFGELLDWAPEAARDAVVHVHWDDAVYKKWDEPVAVHRRRNFLAALRRLRARGCRLFWTVHNRLSHECNNPEAELAFRRELYGLAERVYVHHPLVAGELDWLPDWDKLCLGEHGPYPVTSRDRTSARAALGVGPEERVLLHFGQVRAYKALEATLPVLRRALDRHPTLTAVVIGRIQVPEVRAYFNEHPHPRLLVENDAVSDEYLADCIAAADGGFLSYRDILTSGALFHMLSYGVPPIAPSLGTIPAYVDDGWNGYLYTDEVHLDSVLDRFMSQGSQSLQRLKQNARNSCDTLDWNFP